MRAFKCDKCGTFYTAYDTEVLIQTYNVNTCITERTEYDSDTPVDLCLKCTKKLVALVFDFNQKKKRDKKNGTI